METVITVAVITLMIVAGMFLIRLLNAQQTGPTESRVATHREHHAGSRG
ncbi:hypothetical protein [Streptomyces sp. NPDC048644]